MATITELKLSISHNHTTKTAAPVVTGKIAFSSYELNQMKEGLKFRLKCQLWGEDSGLTGADDYLYTFDKIMYYPDKTPAALESFTFEKTLGEGVLDEDLGRDEVYARAALTNLYTLITVRKNSNTVSHYF